MKTVVKCPPDFLLYSRDFERLSRHKSKKSEILGRCGRRNMVRPYLKIWDWDLIFGQAVKEISSPGVRGPSDCFLAFYAMPKQPINQFKFSKAEKQLLKVYCPNIYILCLGLGCEWCLLLWLKR